MGLSRTVSDIKGDFSLENHKIFAPPVHGSPWNWVTVLNVKKIE